MVALPFFFMLFAVLELGLVFVTDSVLENAVIDASRLVRTGQASNQNFSAAVFKQRMCEQMSVFSTDCGARATVDVRVISQFTDVDAPDPIKDGEFKTDELGYSNGQPGSLMLVSVWYRQPLVTPFLSQGLSRLNDGAAMLTVTTAFRNEPFQ